VRGETNPVIIKLVRRLPRVKFNSQWDMMAHLFLFGGTLNEAGFSGAFTVPQALYFILEDLCPIIEFVFFTFLVVHSFNYLVCSF
jgi:hypothetical protein